MTNFVSVFNNDRVFFEIIGDSTDQNEYLVEFINIVTCEIEYSSTLKINYWAELENIYDKKILIRVTLDNEIVFERIEEQKFNKVYILFGSDALGDTVAWIPYVEEYRRINNVEVVLFTKFNNLFDKAYPNIIFSDINDSNYINDVDKKFRIDYGPEFYCIDGVLSPDSWYINNKKYNNHVKYFDYKKNSLQSIACLILGLEIKEIKSNINISEEKTKIKGKYVVVAMQSTSQLKYWNNPFGWERLFDFLGRNGYKIVVIDKYKSFGIPGNYNHAPKSKYVIDKTGNYSLSDRIIDIKYADMMITISSGLAWVAWAVGTPVVMISGFTKPWNEFQSNIIRIHNPNVCNGCRNDSNFDAKKYLGNWLFCQKNQDFICSKAIQPRDVIDGVKKLIEIKKAN